VDGEDRGLDADGGRAPGGRPVLIRLVPARTIR
jgi:hypothetical protein